MELRRYNILNICGYEDTFKSWGNDIIWNALRDLLLFLQLKNVQSTHTFTKSNTPPFVFSFLKNCINATMSRNASRMIVVSFYRLCFQYCSGRPRRLLNILYAFSLYLDSRKSSSEKWLLKDALKSRMKNIA